MKDKKNNYCNKDSRGYSGPTGGERRAVASRPVDMSRYAAVNATKTATR